MSGRAVFLDRDGVINVDHAYVATVERFEFVPGVLAFARKAVDRGYRVIVATNQSGIGRGYYTEADFQTLTQWMARQFAEAGAALTGVFHCPYYPGAIVPGLDRRSFWRKPQPGMLLDAARTHDVDLGRSLFVGDAATDMAAAAAAGIPHRYFFGHAHTLAGDVACVPVGSFATLMPVLDA